MYILFILNLKNLFKFYIKNITKKINKYKEI